MTTVLESLNKGLISAMQENPLIILLGEDILDPYGGAFKVTRGVSTQFPDQVLTTPISEAGITGIAAGMAMRGFLPVVEIMFGDFLTLAADQIINHAAKFRWMYNDQVRVPMVIRTPMGGRRGYGPTHSQTLEKLFMGVPGMRILAPATTGDPGMLLKQTILNNQDPLLFVENKLQYLLPIKDGFDDFTIEEIRQPDHSSVHKVTFRGVNSARVTILTYGYMVELCRQAMITLAYEDEIFAEMLVYEQLAPFTPFAAVNCLDQNKHLLVVEEGTVDMGWGAEVVARIMEEKGPVVRSVSRIGAKSTPIPASVPLENTTLPGVDTICKSIRAMVSG